MSPTGVGERIVCFWMVLQTNSCLWGISRLSEGKASVLVRLESFMKVEGPCASFVMSKLKEIAGVEETQMLFTEPLK